MKKKLLLGIFVFFLINLTLGLVKSKDYGKVMAEEPGNPPPFYGMIFASQTDFPQFKQWGINLVEIGLGYQDSESIWAGVYEVAIANGIKLIPVLWYEPDTVWTQNFEAGIRFLNFLKLNPRYLNATYALYAFHEPYRYFSSGQLSQVYSRIKAEIPSLKVFCDGCTDAAAQNRDATLMQPGIADAGHHGFYPFSSTGDNWDYNMTLLENINRTIEDNNLDFEVIVYAQTFKGGYPWDKMPDADEMREITQRTFNSSLMKNSHVIGYAWYTWRGGGPYSDYLANHPELYPVVREIYDTYFVGSGYPTSTPTPTSTPAPKDPDLDNNGQVNAADMRQLLAAWGPINPAADEDLDSNSRVNSLDAGRIIANWTGGPPASPTPTSTPPPNVTPTPTPTPPPGATPTPTPTPGSPPTGGLEFYGVEFASTGDFPTLRDQLSVNAVLMSFSPGAGCASWTETLDNAASYGIKIIPILGWKADECNPGGGGGPIWSYSNSVDRKNAANGSWNPTSSGESFLNCMQSYLRGGGQGLAAVYGLHESYWMGTTTCGYSTSVQQELYSEIKSHCPLCKVYSEVGNLYFWEINNEYGGPWSRIQNGAFDYAGIWLYPFNGEGSMSDAQRVIDNDRSLINSKGLSIKLVFLMQTFGAGGYRMPSATEMYNLGCMVLNSKKVEGALWYTWRGGPYSDYLANHSDYYSVSRRVLNDCGR